MIEYQTSLVQILFLDSRSGKSMELHSFRGVHCLPSSALKKAQHLGIRPNQLHLWNYFKRQIHNTSQATSKTGGIRNEQLFHTAARAAVTQPHWLTSRGGTTETQDISDPTGQNFIQLLRISTTLNCITEFYLFFSCMTTFYLPLTSEY